MILLFGGVALASAPSVDVTLSRPSFHAEDAAGLRAPWAPGRGALRLGTVTGVDLDPVVVWMGATHVGTPVAARQTLWLGASSAPARRLSLSADLPLIHQRGDGRTGLDADGAGLGDLHAGLRFTAIQTAHVGLSASGELYLPTGTRSAWMGEALPRAAVGLVTGARIGAFEGLASAGYLARADVETAGTPVVGDALEASAGLRISLWPERASLDLAWVGRRAATNQPEQLDLAASQLGLGMRLWPGRATQLDLGVSKGLGPGLGSTELSGQVGLCFRRAPRHEPPTHALDPLGDDDLWLIDRIEPPTVTEVVEIPPPAATELAWVAEELDQITLRDPIRFAFGTARILPESQPTLEAMASLLQQHPEIAELVIEGHASDEGSFAYNYDLALRRSVAIFEALVRVGVHPERLSVRSMGEVAPTQGDLALNRRVEFHITRRLATGEAPPETVGLQPWDGTPVPGPQEQP